MEETTKKIYLHFISMILVISGGIIWGSIGLIGKNPFAILNSKKYIPDNIFYTLIGLSAGYLLINRDAFLPFLSHGIIPCSVLSVSEPMDWDTEVELPVSEGNMVIYWAADSKNKFSSIPDVSQAYSYNNSGVTMSQGNYAIARIKYPTKYTVNRFGIKKEQIPHIHYRYCKKNEPILSKVFSLNL